MPQFTGQFYIQPPKPRPKSSAEFHPNRIITPTEISKAQDNRAPEFKSSRDHSIEKKTNTNTSLEKKKSESYITTKNLSEKYDTRISITQKVNDDLIKYQTQLEISQLNDKHLREEINVINN